MKLWLCGMTTAGHLSNLKEMIDPVLDAFDGLVWTFNYPKDEGADYLEANKKDGEIIYAKWAMRHGYSMTHFLWQGPMQEGDFFVLLDSYERISPVFLVHILPGYINQMKSDDISVIANFSKGLIFRYNEEMEFKGSPHWWCAGYPGKFANVELPKHLFWHVRNEQRVPFQFVTHYLKYYFYPAGSNHCALGLEKNGDPKILFPIREDQRIQFRKHCRSLGISLTPEAFKTYLLENKDKLDDKMKAFLNGEKILNDYWRHEILGQTDFIDDHDFKNMIKV
jgi:hypothetical protein